VNLFAVFCFQEPFLSDTIVGILHGSVSLPRAGPEVTQLLLSNLKAGA
jgi:hypothetical protein